jgi:hypothetical protein
LSSALGALGVLVWILAARRGEPALDWRFVRRIPYPRALALLGLLALIGACARRYSTRSQLLPKTSVFQKLPASALKVDDVACHSYAELGFVCGPQTLRAAAVDGAAAMHLCMTAPGAHKVSLELATELGSFLEARYESSASAEPGSVRVAVNGDDLGQVAARDREQWPQRVLFDTRGYRGQPSSRLTAEFTGRTLACFDLRMLR